MAADVPEIVLQTNEYRCISMLFDISQAASGQAPVRRLATPRKPLFAVQAAKWP
jgi:hypothetical protein